MTEDTRSAAIARQKRIAELDVIIANARKWKHRFIMLMFVCIFAVLAVQMVVLISRELR